MVIDTSIANLWRAWCDFRRGKKPSRAIIEYESNLLNNLLDLSRKLQTGIYRHDSYGHKIINERKRRDIAVASVADRIVHRLVYDHLVEIYDKTFIYDVWSCRKDKGLDKCVARVSKILREHHNIYIWRTDITKFFQSVDCNKLKNILKRRITDPQDISLLSGIIDSYDDGGIPIGNLTSQIFANIYLNKFDRYVVHVLKPLHYLRYGDDFLIFDPDYNKLMAMRESAIKFLSHDLKLKINPKLDRIQSSKRRLNYLGVDFFGNGEFRLAREAASRIKDNLDVTNLSSYKAKVKNTLPDRYIKRLNYEYLTHPDRLRE